jgi:hypothetical protein
MSRPYSLEEIRILADLVQDETSAKYEAGTPVDADALAREAVSGTGSSVDFFRAVCDVRWNGPVWVR